MKEYLQTPVTKSAQAVGTEPRVRTRLIHGLSHTRRWDYDHHLVPPVTASATFRLDSAERGAQGFAEFMADEFDPNTHAPI